MGQNSIPTAEDPAGTRQHPHADDTRSIHVPPRTRFSVARPDGVRLADLYVAFEPLREVPLGHSELLDSVHASPADRDDREHWITNGNKGSVAEKQANKKDQQEQRRPEYLPGTDESTRREV